MAPYLFLSWRFCRVTARTARLCAILAAAQVVGLSQEIHQTSLEMHMFEALMIAWTQVHSVV